MSPRVEAMLLHLVVALVFIYLGRIDEALIHLGLEAAHLFILRYRKGRNI